MCYDKRWKLSSYERIKSTRQVTLKSWTNVSFFSFSSFDINGECRREERLTRKFIISFFSPFFLFALLSPTVCMKSNFYCYCCWHMCDCPKKGEIKLIFLRNLLWFERKKIANIFSPMTHLELKKACKNRALNTSIFFYSKPTAAMATTKPQQQ